MKRRSVVFKMAFQQDDLFCENIMQWLDTDTVYDSDVDDALLSAASQMYESSLAHAPNDSPSHPTSSTSTARTPTRFARPKSNEEIQNTRLQRIPGKKNRTKYCVKLWNEWRMNRTATTGEHISTIDQMTDTALTHWMSRFVLEVRKVNGSEYLPNSLHHICAGLLRHLRMSGRDIDLFKDTAFTPFQATLDGEMKRLQSAGLGSKKRQAEVITEEEEEKLWSTGQLGDSSPQQLLNTILYYCGLYFALRSGKEHRQLRRSPPQIELFERPAERAYLRYSEDVSKNHPGGLKGRNIKPKVVYHHANTSNPQCCFVRLYKRYMELCPPDAPADSFYLHPSRSPTATYWFSRRPLGHNHLGTIVSKICKSAGIDGFKTNHSLRATSTSRLYQSGVDEQLVMERTGHRSIEGVRSYKRTSAEQRMALSDILNWSRKVPRMESKMESAAPECQRPASTDVTGAVPSRPFSEQLCLPLAIFTGCTVNFYIGKN